VKNWIAVAGRESLDGVKVASIGPITSRTARNLGLTVDVEADPHTIEGLVEAIAKKQAGR
jgi:uroporphyrinogen III methyltransferase/synthase